MSSIEYEIVKDVDRIDVTELLAYYADQGHRTTGSAAKLRRMLQNSFCVVTATLKRGNRNRPGR